MSEPRSSGEAGAHAGFFGSLKNLAATLIVTGRTRLELLSNEFEEEKLRTLRLLLLAQGMVFCLGVGILLGVAFLALAFRDNALLVVGVCAALFLLFAVVLYSAVRRAMHRPDRAFAASLAELEEDLRQLKAAAREEAAGQARDTATGK